MLGYIQTLNIHNMKSFRLFNTFFVLFVSLSSLFGQCDSIVLTGQQEVNQFISKYGKCKEVNDLIIKDIKGDITQFDSLYTIERINGRLDFDFSSAAVHDINIDGLSNLRYVDFLTGQPSKLIGQFKRLDTINYLHFNTIVKMVEFTYIYYFPNLKHIESSLALGANITENTIPKFTTGLNFRLNLYKHIDSTSLKVLSNRIKKENLKSLHISLGDSLNLNYLSIIDSIEYLHFSYCKNSNFSNIANIKNKKLTSFLLQKDLGNNDYGDGLKHVEEIGSVLFQSNKYNLNYKAILPNLKSINRFFGISGHDSLTNLHFLDNVSPPQEAAQHSYATIAIDDNKKLRNCNTLFLCEALAKYPESIIIKYNAGKCTKEEILKYCSTINTIEQQNQYLKISPNPTYGYLKVENIDSPFSITITNLFGQVCKTLTNIENEVNISDLPPGIYVFDIKNKSLSERHKIVKIQ